MAECQLSSVVLEFPADFYSDFDALGPLDPRLTDKTSLLGHLVMLGVYAVDRKAFQGAQAS